tara:strand:+ start:810 stop:1118 length:309 start_codon:yes stop_codon:yes gene_type:complete
MSYHDGYDPRRHPDDQPLGDRSKKNYYDELSFWVSRAKNLETLLIDAVDHIEDFTDLLQVLNKVGFGGEDFALRHDEHTKELEKFLRIATQEIGKKKEKKSP